MRPPIASQTPASESSVQEKCAGRHSGTAQKLFRQQPAAHAAQPRRYDPEGGDGEFDDLHPERLRSAAEAVGAFDQLRCTAVRIEHGDEAMPLPVQESGCDAAGRPVVADDLFNFLRESAAVRKTAHGRKRADPAGQQPVIGGVGETAEQNQAVILPGIETGGQSVRGGSKIDQERKPPGAKPLPDTVQKRHGAGLRQKLPQGAAADGQQQHAAGPDTDPVAGLGAGPPFIRHVAGPADDGTDARGGHRPDPLRPVEIVRHRTRADARQPGDLRNRHCHLLPFDSEYTCTSPALQGGMRKNPPGFLQ